MSTTQAGKVNTMQESTENAGQPSRPRPEWLENLLGYPKRARKYIHEVRAELKLVVWPSTIDVRSTTLVVIMTTAIFAFFLWMVDKGAARAVAFIIKTLGH